MQYIEQQWQSGSVGVQHAPIARGGGAGESGPPGKSQSYPVRPLMVFRLRADRDPLCLLGIGKIN